ncbi:MAG: DHH family phosphoesterase [Christensenellaceae bacterium]|jgi:c-di-AMP phosphodiesterase-like protein|nr:DHH family phosphoesterase [Christensenellaceae bacterium]
MNRSPQTTLIPLAVLALLAGGLLAYMVTPYWYGLSVCGAALLLLAIGIGVLTSYRRAVHADANDIFQQNATAAGSIINNIDLPALLFDDSGQIVWSNHAFSELYDGTDMRRLLPGLDPRFPNQAQAFEFNGRNFQLMSMSVQRSSVFAQHLTFQYWLDRTEALHYSRLYEEQLPTIALIQVDNYDDLNADKQFHRNTVLTEVERKVSDFVSSIEGVYRRYDSSKYFVVFEAKRLAELEKHRFALLDSVREVDTGTGQSVTLSIAVGVSNRIALSDEAARNGMQLALGRGGDQAVVKRGTSYAFYGGKRQVTTRNSRVKARLFANALRQLMESADQVIIVGHKSPDMDCLGAALGLMRCAMLVGCTPCFVLDEVNPTLEGAVDTMRNNPLYRDTIRTPEQALAMLRAGSVLIVVDTQRESSVLAPELYEQANKKVIIDHHRRPVDALQNATLNYLEAGSSSTCEMVTEVLQYFDDNVRPTTFECGALLAGITMDTKHFAFNTGARTFEAASYLRRNGADNTTVKMMFQDDMQTYRNRAKVVETAVIMEQGIAISACPEDDAEYSPLVAAQAADELISIKGIRASFVLAEREGSIVISGRSLGEINVQLILEKLGGGGHLSVAGAQLKGVTMDAAIEQLTQSIQGYLQEIGVQ